MNAGLLLLFLSATIALCSAGGSTLITGYKQYKLPFKKYYCTRPISALTRQPVLGKKCFPAFSVCSDGHILLLPRRWTKVSRYNIPAHPSYLKLHPVIAGFWGRPDSSCFAGNWVTYGQSSNPTLMRRIGHVVKRGFWPQTAIFATYNWGLSSYSKKTEFQIIIATKGTVTYAIFLYGHMGWNCHCFRPLIGYANGKGSGYQYPSLPTYLRHRSLVLRISGSHQTEVQNEVSEESIANLEEALNDVKSTDAMVAKDDDDDDNDDDGDEDDDDDDSVMTEEDAAISEYLQALARASQDDDDDDDDGDDDNVKK